MKHCNYNINTAIDLRSNGIEDAYGNQYVLSFKASVVEAKSPGIEWGYWIPNEVIMNCKGLNKQMTKAEYKSADSAYRKYIRSSNENF